MSNRRFPQRDVLDRLFSQRNTRARALRLSNDSDHISHECTVCLETTKNPRFIAEDAICVDCIEDHIIPQFAKAVENEFDYPVKWGDKVLEIDDITFKSDLTWKLGEDFEVRYKRRAEEYATPQNDRVLCKNLLEDYLAPSKGGEYKGRYHVFYAHNDKQKKRKIQKWSRSAATPDQIEMRKQAGVTFVECGAMVCTRHTQAYSNITQLPQCWSCKLRVHPCCGEPAWPNEPKHVCKYEPPRLTAEEFVADDMVKGRDYQECPNKDCGQVVMLKDGCNHIHCTCGIDFCFLCGEGPLQGMDLWRHWRTGNPCPRYNQPGGANAHFDEGVNDDILFQHVPLPPEEGLEDDDDGAETDGRHNNTPAHAHDNDDEPPEAFMNFIDQLIQREEPDDAREQIAMFGRVLELFVRNHRINGPGHNNPNADTDRAE